MRFFTAAIFSAFAALATAHRDPDYTQAPTGNAILTPGLNDQVTAGQPYTITWTPTTEGPISLVLLRGPSTNVVPIDTLAEQIPNSGSFSWTPSTSLEADVTHYGLLLVVEATGQYQYSTQFGVANSAPVVSSSAAPVETPVETAVTSASTSAAVPTAPVESYSTSYETYEVTTTICPETTEAPVPVVTKPATSAPHLIGTGTANATVPIVAPTNPPYLPTTLRPSGAGPSGTPSQSGPGALFTGAADRKAISFGAVAAGVVAVLAF